MLARGRAGIGCAVHKCPPNRDVEIVKNFFTACSSYRLDVPGSTVEIGGEMSKFVHDKIRLELLVGEGDVKHDQTASASGSVPLSLIRFVRY